MKRIMLLAVLSAVLTIPVAAQERPRLGPGMRMGPNANNFEDFDVATPEHVAGNVYRVVGGAIANMAFSVGDDGIIMVDSNFEALTEKVLAAIREISDAPIRFLIDTHSHFDHAGGNAGFAQLGTVLVAHDNVRVRLADPPPRVGPGGPPQVQPAAAIALPIVTFSDRVSFHFNGEEVEAFHVAAGHTDEDVLVHFKGSDVIHMGDVFVGHFPIVDSSRGGNFLGLITTLNSAIALAGPDTAIMPGHGPISDRDGLIEFRDVIVVIRDRVSVLVDEGKTLEQVIAAKPTADLDKRWAGRRGSDRIITAAYNAITK